MSKIVLRRNSFLPLVLCLHSSRPQEWWAVPSNAAASNSTCIEVLSINGISLWHMTWTNSLPGIHRSHQQSCLRHWLVLLWLWLLSCCYCYRHRDTVATRLHAFVAARSLCLGLLWHGLSAGIGQLHQNTLWLHRCLKKLWLLKSVCCHWLSTPRQPSVQILETEEWGQKVHEGIVRMAFSCFAGHNSIQRYCNPDSLQCRTAASYWMLESPLRSFWSFGKPDWFMIVLMMAWHACWFCSHLTTAGWLADLVAHCAG